MTRRVRSAIFAAIALCAFAAMRGDQGSSDIRKLDGTAGVVPAFYFGMHVHRPLEGTPWPNLEFHAIRLWDTETTWANLEPRRGEWHFERLDRMVNLYASHHVQVLLCFGRTPAWASSIRGHGPEDARVGAGAPVNLDDWRDFVRKVATRYRGAIGAYEIWNEPSYQEFYQGDVPTMVRMAQMAYEVIHSVDPSALVVSPSATGEDGLGWFDSFLAQGGARYSDVIGYHFYVFPDPPEKIVSLASKVKSIMSAHSVKEPLWNTETGWSSPKEFRTDSEANAYVARSLLLAWASGIGRFYWYAWDNENWVTLHLVRLDDFQPTQAAQAFQTTESWMLGQHLEGCRKDPNSTWMCHLTRDGVDSYTVWNPVKRTRFSLPTTDKPKPAWSLTTLTGKTTQVTPEAAFADLEPQLLK